MPKAVLHVDLDAFYVSCESREDPRLRGIPLVVGADPEGGKGRGVVVTCSYEARKFGLRSGMPISQAYRLCPQATYLRPNWGLYEKTSEEVMATLKAFADEFEQSSIDEAFLDVSKRAPDQRSAEVLAVEIQAEVQRKNGLTCSIGVAPNKSAAKIASDMHKPNGHTVVPFNDVKGFLAPLPVRVVPGIGGKTEEFLKEKGVTKISQLQALDGRQLMAWFGKNGVWLWGVVQGMESVEVRQQEMPKSLSVERTFKEDVTNFSVVRREAEEAASELWRRLRSSGYDYKVAGIKIRFKGFETHTREKTLLSRATGEGPLQETIGALLDEFETSDKPFRLIGVRVADIGRASDDPESLDRWTDS